MENLSLLRDTISNVLEEMFFLVEETPPDQFVESYQYITLIEDPSFLMKICMGRDLAREITVNFLGIAQEPEETDILDCLQEVLNMVTGNFVGRAFPNHQTALPIPRSSAFRNTGEADEQSVFLFFRGQPLKIVYRENE